MELRKIIGTEPPCANNACPDICVVTDPMDENGEPLILVQGTLVENTGHMDGLSEVGPGEARIIIPQQLLLDAVARIHEEWRAAAQHAQPQPS